MDILKGLLPINGVDVFVGYGAFPVEEKAGDTKNYSTLLKPPSAKSHTAVSFREKDGEKLPDAFLPTWEARDVTLQFTTIAVDRAQLPSRYSSFLKLLKAGNKGWLTINPPELGRDYRAYYKDCTDHTQLTDPGGEVIAKFNVKFREPVPLPQYLDIIQTVFKMEFEIYNQQGVFKTAVSPSDSDRHVKEVMNDNILNLSSTLYKCVELGVNDYVGFEGEHFTLLEDHKPEQKSTVECAHSHKFYGVESELKKTKILKMVDGDDELSFPYDAMAAERLQLIYGNINRIRGTKNWVIGEVVSSANVNTEYDKILCSDAPSEIARNFNTERWIEGTTINLSRREHGTPASLGYGKGLLRLSRVENDTVPSFTRLYPLGSTRNIVAFDYGYYHLQLPGGVRHVERNIHLGIVKQAEEEAFAYIFLKRIGAVTCVRTEEVTGEDGNVFAIYYSTNEGLNLDPNTHEIEGFVGQVPFQGGELNGRDFEANSNSETKEFEIITQLPYENQQLSGGLLIPKPGGGYILWNIWMSKRYYPLAGKEFEEAVQKHIGSISVDTSVYKTLTDYIYLGENHIDLKLGRRVFSESEIYLPTGTHENRVTKISRRVSNIIDVGIECTYAADYGCINQIESNIMGIQAAYREQLNKDVLIVLKSWDSIDPTEYSVLFAVRMIRTIANSSSKLEEETVDKYLRKDIPDTAKELEAPLKGIKVIGGVPVESLTVEKDPTFKGLLSPEVSTSGFLGGTGWALFWKEVFDAVGIKEKKAVMELDLPLIYTSEPTRLAAT